VIDVRVAGEQIEAQLRAEIPAEVMQGFVGEIDETIETPPDDDRVKAYWVLYLGSGAISNDRIVPAAFVSTLPFIVTVAGGTPSRALFGIEQVRKALAGVEIASGLISEQPFDPGPLRVDQAISPSRHFSPISYLLEP
jgi:hypothetical protein